MSAVAARGGSPTRRWLAPVLVWAFVAFAALTMLPLPFGGDQALYAMFGWRVTRGAVLYRDVWDVKQPGIVWFHGLAGVLFGHNEVGAHLLEVLWWVGGSLLAVRAWRGRLTTRAAVVAIPLLVAGLQLASARAFDVGQVEHLVGVPMLASWWWLQPGDDATSPARRRGRVVAAGVAAAVVGVLKHLYLVVPLAFLVLRLWRAWRAHRPGGRAVAAWWALGLGLGVAPFAAQVVVTRQVHRVWWTYVHAPGLMRALDPPPFSRLVHSVGHAGLVYLPLVLLALVGARRAWTPEHRAGTVDMLAWLVAGGLAVSGQLWWSYQQLLVLVPLALLAAHGVDELAAAGGWRGAGTLARVGAVAAVVAGVVACRPLAQRTVALARHGAGLTAADRRAFREDQEPAEAEAALSSLPLRAPGARPGPILVIGNPIHQLRTGRDQAGAIHGWSAELIPASLWHETAQALAAPHTAYLGVEDAHARYLARSPEVQAVLAAQYRPVATAGGVVWYEHVGAPPG